MIEVESLVELGHTAIGAADAQKLDIVARKKQDAVTGQGLRIDFGSGKYF